MIHKSVFQVRVKLGFVGEPRWKAEIESENERVAGYFGISMIKRKRWQGSRQAEPRAGMSFCPIGTV